jgi:hypothetical protein
LPSYSFAGNLIEEKILLEKADTAKNKKEEVAQNKIL